MNNSSKTQQYKKTQLGYFIDYKVWQDALALLNFQIKQKQTNRHFNTISMFYYEKLDLTCLDTEEYFNTKIASSLFYGLKKEFSVLPYVIPKAGLGLRDYKFFTYPMRAVYYAVGLYLLQLSQVFLNDTYKKFKNIKSFYGGNLHYKSNDLQLNKNNIYYRNSYKEYQKAIKDEIKSENDNKIALKIDIENYFNELSVSTLIYLISDKIKPTIITNLNYDNYTKDQISCLFQFISSGNSGIPQSDNDIISSFIGYLYLVFGDLSINTMLKEYRNDVSSHKIIRYADDIHIYIEFKKNLNEEDQNSLIHTIASRIAEILYNKLGLKLNQKTKIYRLSSKAEKEELLKNIHNFSHADEYTIKTKKNKEEMKEENEETNEKPQEKLNKILEELNKIKQSKIEDYLMKGNSVQKDILKNIYDPDVQKFINTSENQGKIKNIFRDFNFNLVKLHPREIVVIITSIRKDETIANNFRKFCLQKSVITTSDADLIIHFLCQTGFKDEALIKKLQKNTCMENIIDLFLNNNMNCNCPGYYNLTCMKINKLSNMPNIIEQIRLRILSEKNEYYSVALNHLVNEIQAICLKQENTTIGKKNYNVDNVVNFLHSKYIDDEICIKIKNLFDRRNSNSVSHPGSDDSHAWGVTKEEYLDYYNYVGKCLDLIL